MDIYKGPKWLILFGIFLWTSFGLVSASPSFSQCPGYDECMECYEQTTPVPCNECPSPTTPEPCTYPTTLTPTCPTTEPIPTCEDCQPCEECPTTPYPTTSTPCPTTTPVFTTTTYNPTTTQTTCPPSLAPPKFTKYSYQGSLPSWPIAGTTVHLGIIANTTDNYPIIYRLVTSFEFVVLSSSHDIIFTSNIEEGAYVGPNNVMVIEVVAEVVGNEERQASAAILIVFPRPRKDFKEKRIV